MRPPRVRFSPAPSGTLHVGGARTALYNWLHARGHDGTFVVRIEDTDAERVSEASLHGMLEGLSFLGLTWDEGPGVGGRWGPYRQSERGALYEAVARRLREAGHAYEAFETPEELDAQREQARAAGRASGYAGAHRDLDEAARAAYRAQGRQPVLRLVTPDAGTSVLEDLVRGEVAVDWDAIGDFVLMRADGSATYYLANTVDDLAQGISVVARGEDLLSATPRQRHLADLLLAEEDGVGILDAALAEVGLPARDPSFGPVEHYAHLPMLVGADRKKLSKRHGSVAVSEFAAQGFLPEVLVNLLALCGWSPGDGRTEQLSVAALIDRFDLTRVGRNPAYFDVDKLRAFNGDAIKQLAPAALAERLVPVFRDAGLLTDPPAAQARALLDAFAPLLQERIQTLAEAPGLVAFAFTDEVVYDDKAVDKHLRKGRGAEVLAAAAARLAALEDWDAEAILAVFDGLCADLELGRGKVMQPVRVAVAGSAVSPPLPETLALLDRAVVLARLADAAALLAAD